MFRRILIAASFALIGSSSAFAQDVKYEKYKLENGMTVILHEDHSLPVACVNIWYYVGGKDESPGRSGFAHLFEHLMFMGTSRVPGNKFDTIMEGGGGWNNASTSWDRTNYYSFGPSHLLPTLLWLDADRLEDLGKAMTQEKLDKQREVVRNGERQTSEMQPYGRADLKVCEMMFPPGHPYHIEVIGTHEDLQRASLQDVKDFFATFYVPNNASLVVAGDFKPDEIKPLIAKLFGTLPRCADPNHAKPQPVSLKEEKRVTYTDNVQFPRLSLVYHSPAEFAPGDAEMDLAGSILSSGKSSRLYKKLVYEDKIATDVSANQNSSLLGSEFIIEVTAKPEVPREKIEAVTNEVLAEFVAKGPTTEELERQKATVEFDTMRGLESILQKADELNHYNFYFGEPNSFKRDLDRYRQATVEGVKEWVGKTLTPNARLAMWVLPEAENNLAAGRDKEPKVDQTSKFTPQLPETFKLSNGIEVRFWPRTELPLVEVSLFLRGGAAQADDKGAGRAYLTAGMLDEGAGDLDALAFSDALKLLGASFSADSTQETTVVNLAVLKRNLDKAMKLYGDAILQPRFDEKEWDRVKTLHVQALKQSLDRAPVVAARVGMKAFFGDATAYGRPLNGTVESVGKLTLDDLKTWHKNLFVPANATIFLAGDLTKEEAQQTLEKTFGAWKTPQGYAALPAAAKSAPKSDSLRVVLVDKPDAVQTVIRFFMPGPLFADPDRIKYELFNTILGGSFTSRLNQNLRETHGYTYGARSNYVMGPTTGYFVASADVQAEVTGPALAEFVKEFKQIAGGDISADDAAKTRETNRMETIQAFQGLGGLIAAAQQRELNGLPFASLGDDLSAMGAMSEGDLNGLAAKTIPIPLDKAVLVLVGNKTLILKQLAEQKDLNLPTPVEIKAE